MKKIEMKKNNCTCTIAEPNKQGYTIPYPCKGFGEYYIGGSFAKDVYRQFVETGCISSMFKK